MTKPPEHVWIVVYPSGGLGGVYLEKNKRFAIINAKATEGLIVALPIIPELDFRKPKEA